MAIAMQQDIGIHIAVVGFLIMQNQFTFVFIAAGSGPINE